MTIGDGIFYGVVVYVVVYTFLYITTIVGAAMVAYAQLKKKP